MLEVVLVMASRLVSTGSDSTTSDAEALRGLA